MELKLGISIRTLHLKMKRKKCFNRKSDFHKEYGMTNPETTKNTNTPALKGFPNCETKPSSSNKSDLKSR
jgi:hypothetical protein